MSLFTFNIFVVWCEFEFQSGVLRQTAQEWFHYVYSKCVQLPIQSCMKGLASDEVWEWEKGYQMIRGIEDRGKSLDPVITDILNPYRFLPDRGNGMRHNVAGEVETVLIGSGAS